MPRRKTTAGAEIPPLVLTVGHSTRPIEDFIRLLQAHGVVRVADVRTIPRSRHNPRFNADSLPASLHAAGLGYQHMAGLGGPAPHDCRLGQFRLAQRFVPGFRGLHGNARV